MSRRLIKIGDHPVGDHKRVFIIAEAGVNHNGRLHLAKQLVEKAKAAGADAVKFQTFNTEELVSLEAPKADYQKRAVPGKSQFEMLEQLKLSEAEFEELFDYCKKQKIIFLSTPFDLKSAEFLDKLGVAAFKIGSGDLTYVSLLEQIARYQKPIILSTGMATIREVKEAVKIIYAAGNKRLILMHCTSNYPAQYKDVNLRAMVSLKKQLGVPAGYSDHTEGIEIPIAAVCLGACVIEKHLTLDKNLRGPDHAASLNPVEFARMVRSIRHVELSMGDGIKKINPSEIPMRKVARRSIVAAEHIPQGVKITPAMLAIKRPGTGIEPKWINRLTGRKTKVVVRKDQIFSWDFVR